MPSVSSKPHAFRLFGLAVLAGLLALGASGQALAAPTAPAPLSPAASASVTIPFTISWSAASDPSGILAYNWQVSATSTFAKIARQSSVMAPATKDSVSGLAPGSYLWRVQAVSNDFVQGPWSATRAVQVTGTGAAPQTPTLNQPRGGNSFHPWESFGMSWSGVPGAVKYVLEASKDPAFPVNGVVFQWESPTPSTDILITTVDRDGRPEDLAHLEAAAGGVEAVVEFADLVGEEVRDRGAEDAGKLRVEQPAEGAVERLAIAGIIGLPAVGRADAHGQRPPFFATGGAVASTRARISPRRRRAVGLAWYSP